MKSVMKKSGNVSKRASALKIVKKSKSIALKMKKSKQVNAGLSTQAKMRVILPRDEFKFRFTLPDDIKYEDDEDDVELDEDEDEDVELDEDDDSDQESPVSGEEEDVEIEEDDDSDQDSPAPAGFDFDEEVEYLAWEESMFPDDHEEESMLDQYHYDNYLYRC